MEENQKITKQNIAECERKITDTISMLKSKCGKVVECPKYIIDATGKKVKVTGTTPLDKCSSIMCALDQSRLQNSVYNVYADNKKWQGISQQSELKDMTSGDMAELGEQVKKFCDRQVSQINDQITVKFKDSWYIVVWNKIKKVLLILVVLMIIIGFIMYYLL